MPGCALLPKTLSVLPGTADTLLNVRRHYTLTMKSTFIALLVLCIAVTAFAQGEYFVTHGPDARALSKEIQTNAHSSPARFDSSQDVSKLGAWLIGSCPTATEDFHLIAYFSTPQIAYVAVFRRDKQLHALWKFQCDARQFYAEGTKLIFVARPLSYADTAETFAKVPREVVIDFGSLPPGRKFKFHDTTYTLPE
jgi:hypothetical protein